MNKITNHTISICARYLLPGKESVSGPDKIISKTFLHIVTMQIGVFILYLLSISQNVGFKLKDENAFCETYIV